MSLGFDAISALPFATSGPDTDVAVVVTGNQLTITIGSVGIIADAVTVNEPKPSDVAFPVTVKFESPEIVKVPSPNVT